MLLKQKLAFSKKCKNVFYLMPPFKVWPISSDFNFSCKDGRVTAATYNYYCPLVVNPIITNACKKLHLKCDKVPRAVFANVAMHENQSGFVWKLVFFLIISKLCHLYRKSLCFSLLLFYSMMKFFQLAFQTVATTILFLWIQSTVQSQNYL